MLISFVLFVVELISQTWPAELNPHSGAGEERPALADFNEHFADARVIPRGRGLDQEILPAHLWRERNHPTDGALRRAIHADDRRCAHRHALGVDFVHIDSHLKPACVSENEESLGTRFKDLSDSIAAP